MNDLMTIIRQRYSERGPFDSDRQVPTADVEKILEAARWAPTSHNMQNFEIVVVDDERLLNLLGNLNTIPSPEFIRENYEQLSMTEEELARKKVGILGNQFPPSWQDKAQLDSAIKDQMPLSLGRLINGAPTILILLYRYQETCTGLARRPARDCQPRGRYGEYVARDSVSGHWFPDTEHVRLAGAKGSKKDPGNSRSHGRPVCDQAWIPLHAIGSPSGPAGNKHVCTSQ